MNIPPRRGLPGHASRSKADEPQVGTDISLADVGYRVTIYKDRLELILSAEIRTYGKKQVVLGLPMEEMAVTEAALSGKAAQLQAGPEGMVLLLPGGVAGRLQLKAVSQPKYRGRSGSVRLTLPPLPAAVINVDLPDDDLLLEIDGIEGTLARQVKNNKTLWSAPLGMARELSLRWIPQTGESTADRTLSARITNDIYAFHWGIVGISKIRDFWSTKS